MTTEQWFGGYSPVYQKRLPPVGFGMGRARREALSFRPSVEGDQVDLVENHRLTWCSLSSVLVTYFEAWMRQGQVDIQRP